MTPPVAPAGAAAYAPERGPSEAVREELMAVADFGRVRWVQAKGRRAPVIDFSPELRDRRRFLWSFYGRAFRDDVEAEEVRRRICGLATELGSLTEAIDRFRSPRSRRETVWSVCEQFLAEAPLLGSSRTGQPYAARTLGHYRAVLERARGPLEAATMSQLFRPRDLAQLRAWFQAPPPDGRGLEHETEAANCFAALRAVVRHYQLDHPDFDVAWPPMPTKTTIAKRARKARLKAHERGRLKLTLPQVAHAIEAIPARNRALFWVWFFTQARKTEIRAVLGRDYHAGRISIERSAEGKAPDAPIRHSTKTDHDGVYEMPDFVVALIEEHCTHARFDPELPLFRPTDARARGPMYSDDAIAATWRTALEACDLPWVPPYQAMKHTGVSALLDAGVPIEWVLDQTRLTTASVLGAHYDEAKAARRKAVVGKLVELSGRE